LKTRIRPRLSFLLEHGILAFLVITAVCLIFLVLSTIFNERYWPLLLPRTVACVIGCAAVGAYFLLNTARAKQWLFAFSVLNISVNVAINHEIYLREGWNILVPFFGLKLLAVAAALAAPAICLPAHAAFVAIIGAAFAQFLWWTPEQRAWVGLEEPWITIGFVVASYFIWYARRRGIELMRQKAALAAQNEIFKKFAVLLLGAQHLMNSPLQTIAANVRLIELENPESAERVRAIDRAFEVVQKVGQIISFGDDHIHWKDTELPTDLEGFSIIVGQLVQKMNEPPPA